VALLVALAAGAVFWLRRVRRPGEGMPHPLAEGIAMVLMVLAPSLAWTYYFAFLIPAVAIAARACPPTRRWPVAALLGAAVAPLDVVDDHRPHEGFIRRAASDAAAAPSW
jgi:hypothetical protein